MQHNFKRKGWSLLMIYSLNLLTVKRDETIKSVKAGSCLLSWITIYNFSKHGYLMWCLE